MTNQNDSDTTEKRSRLSNDNILKFGRRFFWVAIFGGFLWMIPLDDFDFMKKDPNTISRDETLTLDQSIRRALRPFFFPAYAITACVIIATAVYVSKNRIVPKNHSKDIVQEEES